MSQEDEGASARSGASQAEAQASQAEAQATTLAAPGSDAILVEALRRGDENAFARLVDQYHPTLRRIARLYISKKEAVDEVVQDTWLAVIQGIWAFQGRSSVKTWIMRILINQAKTRGIREGRMVPFADLEVDEADSRGETSTYGRSLPDPRPSQETRLLTEEARVRIRAAIDSLPANQRIVITMRDIEGYSSEEVRNVLGVSETNQRVILHRARSKVRAMVADYFSGGST